MRYRECGLLNENDLMESSVVALCKPLGLP